MSEPETPILTVRVDAATIPVSGHEIRLEASQSQCEALASAYNLVGVKSLCATLKVEKRNRGAFVSGRIVAEIVQNCVITLEPVMQSIDEQVEVEFMAAGGHGRPPQVDVDLNGPDRPDLPEDGIVDVGALIEEHLALAVDPYPRSEGAEIPAEYRSPAVGADDSPFSTLLGLRTDARSLGETRPKSKD